MADEESDSVNVDVEMVLRTDGLVDIAFKGVHPNDIDDLFASLGTDEGRAQMADQIRQSWETRSYTLIGPDEEQRW